MEEENNGIHLSPHSELDFGFELSVQTARLEMAERFPWFSALPREQQNDMARFNAEQVREALHIDPLTGLYTKKGMEDMLKLEMAISRRTNESFAVLLIDANFFKSINDETAGAHQTGDAAIKAIGLGIKHSSRETDLKGRIGGDEFMVILRGIKDPTQAHMIAQKMLTQTSIAANREVPTIKKELGRELTLSGGVAIYNPEQNLDISEVIKQADNAALAGKSAYPTKGNVIGYATFDQTKGWQILVPPTDLSPHLD